MSLQPAIITGSLSTPNGVAAVMADVKRRIARLEAEKTIIGDGSITGTQIAAGSIDGSLIVSGSITAAQIAAGTITAAQIAAGSITASLIQAGAINASHIQANSITANEIAANAITASELAAGSVVAGDITAGAVTAGTVAAGAITATTIAADSIATAHIQAGAVDATKISVSTLSAITTNMGSINAGTITGATIQSGSSGSRTVMDSLGFRGYALDGITKTFEINTGSGVATLTGVVFADPSSVIPGGSVSGVIPTASVPTIGGGNALKNASFEDGVARWQNSTNAVIASSTAAGTFRYGTKSLSATSTAAANTRVRQQTGTPAADLVRVDPGDHIVVSGYSKAATTPRSARVYVVFADAAGATVSGGSMIGSNTTNSTSSWTRHFSSGVAPAGTVYAYVMAETVSNAAGEVHYWDDFQIEFGDVPTAFAPKPDEILPSSITGAMITDGTVTEVKIGGTISGAKITDGTVVSAKIGVGAVNTTNIAANAVTANEVAAGAITANKLNVILGGGNFLTNSGFENTVNPIADWNVSGGTAVGDVVVFKKGFGQQSAKLTVTGTASTYMTTPNNVAAYTDVSTGKSYTASFWIKKAATNTGTASSRAVIQWYDAADAFISSSFGPNVTADSTIFQRCVATAAAPAGAVKARLVAYAAYLTSVVGDIYYLDDAQLEEGDVPTSYAPRTDEILPGTIVGSMVAADTITATQIASSAITASEVAAGAITANKLAIISGGGNSESNSSFEDATISASEWGLGFEAPAAGTISHGNTERAKYGTKSIKTTATAAGSASAGIGIIRNTNRNPVAEGKTYTATVWCYFSAAKTGRIFIVWYNAASGGSVVGTNVFTDAAVPANTWTRLTVTGVAPVGATHARNSTRMLNPAIGDFAYWDGVQFEEGDVSSAWTPKVDEILPGTIVASMVAADTITANEIASNAITVNELAANSVTAAKIAANTITASQIASATITATQLAANSVTATQIAAGAVTANSILAGSIATSHLSFLSASQNMMLDSGFELSPTTSTPWQNSNATYGVIAVNPRSGTNVGTLTAVGGIVLNDIRSRDALNPPAVANKTYSARVYVRQTSATAGRQASLFLGVLDSGNVLLQTAPIVYTNLPADTTTWTPLTITWTPTNASAAKIRVTVRYRNSDGVTAMPSNETLHMDEFTLVPGDVLPPNWEPKAGDIQPGSVGNTQLGPDSVTTDKILAASILGTDIGAATITGTNIAGATITAGNIAAGTITATNIAAGAIEASKINLGAIPTYPNLLPNSSFERRSSLGVGTSNGGAPIGWVNLGNQNFSVADTSGTQDGSSVLVVAPTVSAGTVYTTSSEKIPVVAGDTIYLSAYVRKQAGHTGTTEASLAINYTDAAGNGISDDGTPGNVGNSSSQTTITSTTVFTRIIFARTAPVGAVLGNVYLGSKTSAANGTTGLVWDCAQAEKNTGGYSSWSLRAIEQAMPGTEILPGSIYTGNIHAGSIDGQVITGATLQTSRSWPKMKLDEDGLTLPSTIDSSPGIYDPSTVLWTTTEGGSDWAAKMYGQTLTGFGSASLIIQSRDLTAGGTVNGANAYFEAIRSDATSYGATGGARAGLQSRMSPDFGFSESFLWAAQPTNSAYTVAVSVYQDGTNGTISFERSTGTNGIFTGAPVYAASYNAFSDAELKNSVRDAQHGLETTRKLKPRSYKLKGVKNASEAVGFVAQEVESAFPEAVTNASLRVKETGLDDAKGKNKREVMAVDLSQMIALGVQTDIELDARIDALEAELAELKAKLK